MSQSRIKFGVYDFDLDTCELCRGGSVVRLQPQPAQVLRVLIEAEGQIVSRERIRELVWGTEVHVDFDRALNYAVSQIRSALRDSAESPRYIETIPKAGYRLLALVEKASREQAVPENPEPAVQDARGWSRRTLVIGGGGFSLLGAAAGLSRMLAPRGGRRIAVALFDNETSDSSLDRFANDVTDSLIVALTASTMGAYQVIGNAALLRQKRSFRDLEIIARDLKARFVILGQVKAGKGTRGEEAGFVLAHLIRMPDQVHLQVARVPLGEAEPVALEISRGFVAALARSQANGSF